MAHHVFGIRHHGPGSARSLAQALAALAPDCVLIEGPPEGEAVLPLVLDPDMRPPVALLVYAPDAPQRAVYYPFAEFSPEWQAIRHALAHGIPVRFMDLPAGIRFAQDQAEEARRQAVAEAETEAEAEAEAGPDGDAGVDAATADTEAAAAEAQEEAPEAAAGKPARAGLRHDPIALLAEAAGYADSERWWEHMVEERQDSGELFQAIAEAMGALRQTLGEEAEPDPDERSREALREAWMRKTLRQAQKDGFERIAVVCGAWHVPALETLPPAKADNERLKGLPKLKTAATWVPWTHDRLSTGSGYGAGIASPGWYAHLWQHPQRPGAPWLVRVAHTFRTAGLDISSAHVIEAVRLAETLAAMRGRPLPGLAEMNEAVQSVMLFGDALPMRLLERKLLIGEVLGHIPASTPQTPLQQDLAREQKRLRLKPGPSDSELVLDLRKDTDLGRSHLLRRLRILDVPWGKGGQRAGGKGTFKESWRLLWQPEFEVSLIEAGLWGNTLEEAASTRLVRKGADNASLEALAQMTHEAMFANLAVAVDALIGRLQAEAAVSHDILHLMQALPELAQLLRYGDVRKTSLDQVESVLHGLLTRICIGLPNATASLNAEAAERFFEHIQRTHAAVKLLDDAARLDLWHDTLAQLMDRHGLHPLLAGRCCRLLLQSERLDEAECARRLGLALSAASAPDEAAAWVDGFLRGSGQLLIHDETLWALIDGWVCSLSPDTFQPLLPVLRRTFASFEAPERRQMGERVKAGTSALPALALTGDLDPARAAAALPVIGQLLGLETPHAA